LWGKVVTDSVSEDVISRGEFLSMVEFANFFNDPKTPEFFKSLNHIGLRFESRDGVEVKTCSPMVRRVLKKMWDVGFIRLTRDDFYEFDEVKFDGFVDESKLGQIVWTYARIHATVLRTR
jgi:hypothetical protein